MAILNIRNLPDDVHVELRVRAARHGKSMEAEAREILAHACRNGQSKKPASSLRGLVDKLYGSNKPINVAGDLINERRREAKRE